MKTIGRNKSRTIIAQHECDMICDALIRAEEMINNANEKEDKIKNNKEPRCK